MTTAVAERSLTADEAWLFVVHCRWYELALRRHGYTTERLTRLAQKVAVDTLRLRGASLQDRFDDLVSRLVIVGLQAAISFDPERQHLRYGSRGGNPFGSYVADIMAKRVDDFWRSKHEGFGDRRRGQDDRVVLMEEVETPEQVDFGFVLDVERAKWQQAATTTGQDLDAWIVNVLNRAAKSVLTQSAA